MTTTDHDAVRPSPTPKFSVWSPVVACVADISTSFSPGWVVALTWAVGVLCALAFKRLRLVVPLALVTWGAGWLLYYILFILLIAESRLVGPFFIS